MLTNKAGKMVEVCPVCDEDFPPLTTELARHLRDEHRHVNKVQRLQFELMRLSSFNEFDGDQVVDDLLDNRDLWLGCVWGRFRYGELITLRDIPEGVWNTDTLYIYTTADKVAKLKRLAKKWKADEFGAVYADRKEGVVAFDHTEVSMAFGAPLQDDECIVRIWWD